MIQKEMDKDTMESPLIPRESRWRRFWRLFRKNQLAFLGLVIFVLFFLTAVAGLILTSGSNPYFDPAIVRLEEKLRPPLSAPRESSIRSWRRTGGRTRWPGGASSWWW